MSCATFRAANIQWINCASETKECHTHLCQSPSDRAGLLRSEVKGQELFVLVVLAQVLSCLLVHHGQHPGNRLADGRAACHAISDLASGVEREYAHLCELRRRSTGDLLHPQGEELGLQLIKLLRQVIFRPNDINSSSARRTFETREKGRVVAHLDWSS